MFLFLNLQTLFKLISFSKTELSVLHFFLFFFFFYFILTFSLLLLNQLSSSYA